MIFYYKLEQILFTDGFYEGEHDKGWTASSHLILIK